MCYFLKLIGFLVKLLEQEYEGFSTPKLYLMTLKSFVGKGSNAFADPYKLC